MGLQTEVIAVQQIVRERIESRRKIVALTEVVAGVEQGVGVPAVAVPAE